MDKEKKSEIHITNNFNAPIGQHIDHVDTINFRMDGDGNFHFGMVENVQGGKQVKDEVDTLSQELLAKAVLAVQGYYWANAAHAVVFCVCRDRYNYPDNMSQFETMLMDMDSLKFIKYPCKEGTITTAFFNNPYLRIDIDKWEMNGAKRRALVLRDKFIEVVQKERATTD